MEAAAATAADRRTLQQNVADRAVRHVGQAIAVRRSREADLYRVRRLRLFDEAVYEPGREHRRDQANHSVQDELNRAAVRSARAVGQRREEEGDRTDQHDAPCQVNPLDVKQNVFDSGDQQRRQDAEQIAVLQRLEEDDEELRDLREIGLGPVTGLVRWSSAA